MKASVFTYLLFLHDIVSITEYCDSSQKRKLSIIHIEFSSFATEGEEIIILETNIIIGRVIIGVIVGVDNVASDRVIPPGSPDHHGLAAGALQDAQLILLTERLETWQPLAELYDQLYRGQGGLGHLQ